MPVNKVVFLSYSPIKTALEHLRVLGPLSHTEIQVINGIEGDKPNLDLVRTGDLVVFQRNFSSRYRAYQSVMNEAHKHGIPVVLDLDDYLIGLPPDHPDRKWSPFAFELPALLHAIMNVDAITVTTPVLKSVLDQYNKNIFILPNYLDDSIWSFRTMSKEKEQPPVRIAFVGTQSHQPDMEKIAGPLSKIANKFEQKLAFLFYGMEIPEVLRGLENAQHRASVTYDYANFALDVRSISADIAIAPLNDTLFNRCKSPIKYLEYTAMGIPGVYSRIAPYTDVIKDGFNGFLADKPNEWIEKINTLIDDQILREQLLVNAQRDVRSNWMLHDHAHLWQTCYDQVLERGLQDRSGNSASLTALGQTAEQIEEQVIKQAEKTAFLTQVLQETQAQNANLKDTVLREEVRVANLLLAEKEHSSNLLKERGIYKEESERKTTRLEALNARIAELEKQNVDLAEQNTRELLQLTQDKQGLVDAMVNLQKEHQELRDSIIELTRENQSLVDALKLSQGQKKEDQNTIDALTQEKQWFVDTLVQLRKENQNYKKLNQQIDLQKSIAQEDVSRLESELKDLQTNLEAKLLENKNICEDVSRLEGELKDLQTNLEAKSLENITIRAEFEKLNQSTMAIHVQNDGKSIRIAELEEQNKGLATELENTKREVVDYVMSDSWKITKPLRRIVKIFKKR